MSQGKRPEVKETSLKKNTRNRQSCRIFSSKRTPSQLLQKKPQILLMKWNDLLEKYYLYKQLHNINGSLPSVGLQLKKRKQQLTIYDVPYIQSQQVSISDKFQPQQQSVVYNEQQIREAQISNVKASQKTLSSATNYNQVGKIPINSSKQIKKILFIHLNQSNRQDKPDSNEDSSQNFTDQEQQQIKNSLKNSSKVEKQKQNNKFKGINEIKCGNQQKHLVADSLRKTAYFSFSNMQLQSKKSVCREQNSIQNQQNVNVLNSQIKSKKIEVLLKLQSEKQLRRQRARKIIQQDRKYLSKIINRK